MRAACWSNSRDIELTKEQDDCKPDNEHTENLVRDHGSRFMSFQDTCHRPSDELFTPNPPRKG